MTTLFRQAGYFRPPQTVADGTGAVLFILSGVLLFWLSDYLIFPVALGLYTAGVIAFVLIRNWIVDRSEK